MVTDRKRLIKSHIGGNKSVHFLHTMGNQSEMNQSARIGCKIAECAARIIKEKTDQANQIEIVSKQKVSSRTSQLACD